jgi:hypothetical protein
MLAAPSPEQALPLQMRHLRKKLFIFTHSAIDPF